MNTTKISITQAFTLLTLFLLGSSVVLGLNLEAEENAWVINTGASLFGIFLFFFYTYILQRNGWPEFHQLLEIAFGKLLGKISLLLYSFYFLYIGTRVMKDFIYFVSHIFFYNADHGIISFVFICLIGYAATLGLEAVARTSELLFAISLFLIILIILFSFLSGIIMVENIRPFIDLEVIQLTNWIKYITFPYGEMVVFLVIFPFINDRKKWMKRGWISVVLCGLILISITEIIIAILGAKVSSLYTFPLVKAIEMIEFLGVIQHLELLTAFSFIIVGFVKMSIFFIAGIKGVSYTFPFLQEKFIIFLIALSVYIATFYIAEDMPEHLYIGLKIVPVYLHIPFQFIIPLIILALTAIKSKSNRFLGS
ncbi:endospore germination permease [Sutcliffiella sp. NPDC057660]|uniref:GerAB/ArcD/ProY family transporter n=1 Tax=Sutcliffiella sp. NPDC057660 TaxID=3346199 RepID=UPI003688381A